jgi:hypothetical protein
MQPSYTRNKPDVSVSMVDPSVSTISGQKDFRSRSRSAYSLSPIRSQFDEKELREQAALLLQRSERGVKAHDEHFENKGLDKDLKTCNFCGGHYFVAEVHSCVTYLT